MHAEAAHAPVCWLAFFVWTQTAARHSGQSGVLSGLALRAASHWLYTGVRSAVSLAITQLMRAWSVVCQLNGVWTDRMTQVPGQVAG
jgi:hypothetical protein